MNLLMDAVRRIVRETAREACRRGVPDQWQSAHLQEVLRRRFHGVRTRRRQIDQVSRRLLRGETIPQNEKVFSIFEPNVRWITEGKAGSPAEPVVPTAVVEDQHQFITVMRLCSKVLMFTMPFRSSRRRRSGFRNSGPAVSTAAFPARRTAGNRLRCLI